MRKKISLIIALPIISSLAIANTENYTIDPLLRVPDGITASIIKAGSHTSEQNIINEKACKEEGGYDVTDKQDIIVGIDTTDARICFIPDSAQQEVKNLNARNAGTISTPSVPYVTAKYGQNYRIYGSANYAWRLPLQIIIAGDLSVISDNCYVSGSEQLPTSNGIFQLSGTCHAKGLGQAISKLDVCFRGGFNICSSGLGTVIRNQ